MQSLKDKISELESDKKALEGEIDRLKHSLLSIDTYKQAILRKDTVVKNLRSQLEQANLEIQTMKSSEVSHQADAEKRIRQLQRQVDSAIRSQDELEKESQLMRKRLIATAEREKIAQMHTQQRQAMESAAERTVSVASLANASHLRGRGDEKERGQRTTASQFISQSLQNHSQQQQQQQQQAEQKVREEEEYELLNVPHSLDTSARDLSDLVGALGGSHSAAFDKYGISLQRRSKGEERQRKLDAILANIEGINTAGSRTSASTSTHSSSETNSPLPMLSRHSDNPVEQRLQRLMDEAKQNSVSIRREI